MASLLPQMKTAIISFKEIHAIRSFDTSLTFELHCLVRLPLLVCQVIGTTTGSGYTVSKVPANGGSTMLKMTLAF